MPMPSAPPADRAERRINVERVSTAVGSSRIRTGQSCCSCLDGLGALALADRRLLDHGMGIEVHPDRGGRLDGATDGPPVHGPEADGREHDILHEGHRSDEEASLGHRPDAGSIASFSNMMRARPSRSAARRCWVAEP